MVSPMKALLAAVALVAVMELGLVSANFMDFDIPWGKEHAEITEGGDYMTLSLVNKTSGCMLQTKQSYIYGSATTRIMLVKGDSAGIVTTYYTSSLWGEGINVHDEIDFEFLGNSSGNPYTIHTNVFADGVGAKEMQFRPWFDPTTGFHNYTIFWNPCMIVWYVDSYPIRVFRNYESEGVPFPTKRPMFAYTSIWNADDWATQGGRVKTNWTLAPFVSEYRDLNLNVCECAVGADDATCAAACASTPYAAKEPCQLSQDELRDMKALHLGYKMYDYCEAAMAPDNKDPVPRECELEQY